MFSKESNPKNPNRQFTLHDKVILAGIGAGFLLAAAVGSCTESNGSDQSPSRNPTTTTELIITTTTTDPCVIELPGDVAIASNDPECFPKEGE